MNFNDAVNTLNQAALKRQAESERWIRSHPTEPYQMGVLDPAGQAAERTIIGSLQHILETSGQTYSLAALTEFVASKRAFWLNDNPVFVTGEFITWDTQRQHFQTTGNLAGTVVAPIGVITPVSQRGNAGQYAGQPATQ